MGSLRLALDAALDAVPFDVRDTAAQQLARVYADQIDDEPDRLDALGPKLLATLVQLGMTPVARGVAKGGQDAAPVVSKLDELRERRRRRDAG